MISLPILDTNGVATDCKGCGACCIFDWPEANEYGVILAPGEEDQYPGKTTESGRGIHLKTKFSAKVGYHCIMFDVENRLCKVYDNRPDMCRNWQRRFDCKFDIQRLKQLLNGEEKPKRRRASFYERES